MLLQSSTLTSPFHTTTSSYYSHFHFMNLNLNLNTTTALLPKSPFLGLGGGPTTSKTPKRLARNGSPRTTVVHSSVLETPVLWAGRICIYYALLKAGLAGSQANPLVSDLETGSGDLGFSKWFEELQSKPVKCSGRKDSKVTAYGHCSCCSSKGCRLYYKIEKEASDRRKLVSKWHPTTKGRLRRNYRVPSKSEGRRLLKAIASLLSDDDHFRDATSHKGCQIRRESAHGETVCCNNVRALFDELPTPHLIVEITAFPAGPLTDNDYAKAEKLERVLRSSPCV